MIKLNPRKLENPDLGLRYIISDKIVQATNGKISDDGYDFLDDGADTIALFLKSDNPKVDVAVVLDILKKEIFLGNNIHQTAEVYISEIDDSDIDGFELVYQPTPEKTSS